MAIKKIEEKKWEVRISYRDKDNPNDIKNIRRRFTTRSEALKFESSYQEMNTSGINKKIKYHEMLEEYFAFNKTKANPETIKDKRATADRFFDLIKNKAFYNVSARDYLSVWILISESDLSVSRKNKVVTLMKSVARYAYNYHDFKDRTKSLEKFSKNSDDIKEVTVWTSDQFDIFLSHVENNYFRAFFVFAFRTGARRGEIRALYKDDVKNGEASLNKSVRRGVDTISSMKTAKSKRTIRLDQKTIDAILPLYNYPGEFLFGGKEPLSNSSIQRAFDSAFESANEALHRAELEPLPKIRIHDFRHSHASILINNGANIVGVSRRLGHSDVETTLRTYTHLLQKTEDELIELLEKI